MNPLMDALKLADDPNRAPATSGIDVSPDLAFFGDRQLDPVRATRGDTGPTDSSSAAPGADESPGPQASDAWRLGPIRATRGDMDEPVPVSGPLRSHAAASTDPAHPDAVPTPAIPVGPFRVTEPGVDVTGGHGGRALHDQSGAAVSESAAPGVFHPRNLRRIRGVARVAGLALSLLAVAGTAAGGGYFIWKTEFVRPALVGHLSRGALPVVDLTPVHAASAAMNEVGEQVVSPARRADTSARLLARHAPVTTEGTVSAAFPVAGTPEWSGTNATAESRTSEDTTEVRAVSTTETSIWERSVASRPHQATETRGSGRLEWMAVPGERSAGSASSTSSPGHAGRTTPGRRNRLPETGSPRSAPPVVEARAAGLTRASVAPVDFPVPEPNQDGAERQYDVGAGVVVRKRTRPDYVAASLERAYRAFLSDDGSTAADAYRVVLGHEPANRDAHLGLAAVAARAGRWNEAAGHYARVLESHPADTVARAALIAIDELDPARGESRLKALLESEPNAAHLHFDLGCLYAAQRRWTEAQRSWSRAYRFDRDNADYAYNLAVSLDHLSRPETALGLYRKALLLSRSRAVGFEIAAVAQRIRALESHADAGSESARPAADAAIAAPAARIP